ncbi:MAG: bifunctional 3-deoxy-7-phosphoheptulonate synthase/chorismate mutase type II [Microscillaceae bacterium]|nr:bifunctional 3-deoxy-7-phosphoheptulonate synthase/chorismate mutase type II [Microscillaceae bacterium]
MVNYKMELEPLQQWIQSPHRPVIISGPCSAESEDQLLRTCQALKAQGIDVLRAGIWKPRTRPNSFEGYGEKALPWLKAVRETLQLPFAVEVANPQHIELALKYGVDILWLGARTTVNPFNVQEIADALRGVDVPVMIKNPINPDLALWIGAIERIYNAGIRKMAVIHRGFSSFQASKYRNVPAWQIPIELKTYLPNMPIICDPSHIAGKREYLQEIAQKALDLNYDGLMIESHIDPSVALSDAEQQVSPAQLQELLANLKIRIVRNQSDDPELINYLDDLRDKIDSVDRELIEILKNRMVLVEKACEYKRANNITIFQVDRWNEIFRTRSEWARKMHLNQDFVTEIYKLIHVESIRRQTEVITRQELAEVNEQSH